MCLKKAKVIVNIARNNEETSKEDSKKDHVLTSDANRFDASVGGSRCSQAMESESNGSSISHDTDVNKRWWNHIRLCDGRV